MFFAVHMKGNMTMKGANLCTAWRPRSSSQLRSREASHVTFFSHPQVLGFLSQRSGKAP